MKPIQIVLLEHCKWAKEKKNIYSFQQITILALLYVIGVQIAAPFCKNGGLLSNNFSFYFFDNLIVGRGDLNLDDSFENIKRFSS